MEKFQFQPGDVIEPMASPFVKLLYPWQKGRLCDNCFQPGTNGILYSCECQKMFYCGEPCLKLHYNDIHMMECTSKVFRNPPSLKGTKLTGNITEILLQIYAKRNISSENTSLEHYDQVVRSLDTIDLIPEQDEPITKYFNQLARDINEDIINGSYKSSNFVTAIFFFNAFWAWKRNSYPIYDVKKDDIGTGLYVPHAGTKHSCKPNAIFVYKDGKLELRCIHPIPSGEQPKVAYFALARRNLDLEARQNILKGRYRIDCTCDSCLKEKENGPLVNFDKLKSLKIDLEKLKGSNYETAMEIRDEGLAMLRKLYFEYDPRITNFHLMAFDVVHRQQLDLGNVPKDFLHDTMKDIDKRLGITFGTESDEYAKFREKVEELQIKLETVEVEIMYKPGDIIVPMSKPFIKILCFENKGKFCDYCFKPIDIDLHRCSSCKINCYCNRTCQRRDWKEGHSVECKSIVFKKEAPIVTEQGLQFLEILRTLAKIHLKPESFQKKFEVFGRLGPQQRSFIDLTYNTLMSDYSVGEYLSNLDKRLKQDPSYKHIDFDLSFLRRIFGVWMINRLVIGDVGPPIGYGIYINMTPFDHSCRPDAIRVTDNGDKLRQELRCIHPIPKGKSPTFSYLFGNMDLTPLGREERQGHLQSFFRFACTCDLCTAERSGPLVDYGKFIQIKKQLKNFSGLDKEMNELINENLSLLRTIFYEYDHRIAAFMQDNFFIAHEFIHCCNGIKASCCKEKAKELEKRVDIAYGKVSQYYQKFQEKLEQSGILQN